MYKIGEFSKITSLSIKTLRYYDDENILKPSYRNQDNGYRYYNEGDFDKAKLIILLKNLEFTISEIKDVLNLCKNEEDLNYVFIEKKTMIEENIKRQQELLKKFDDYSIKNSIENKKVVYEIGIKDIPKIKVASIRYKGRYDECGSHLRLIYKVVNGNYAGYPFSIYHDEGYKKDADIEVGVVINRFISSTKISCKELPSSKILYTTHYGEYNEIGNAYKAIFDYANKNNIKCVVPSREVYIKGPGMIFKGNPKKYITEVMVSIEED